MKKCFIALCILSLALVGASQAQEAPASDALSADQAREENAYAVGLQAFLWGYPLIGSTTDGLKPDADGSLTILIQKERPADTSNWLPAPAGPFNLTMRLYRPELSVLDGSYRLPAVTRAE